MDKRMFTINDVTHPEDIRKCLADPIKHWKEGYSAYELATAWVNAGDFPDSVRAVLDSHPVFQNARLIEAFFEKKVYLETPGHPSQNDILVYTRLKEGFATIAVEGKVKEAFDQPVYAKEMTPGVELRLQNLCERLGLQVADVQIIRYQLLHRAVSAILEAERYCAEHALMLVHSFDPVNASFDDYRAFARIMGFPAEQVCPNHIVGCRQLGSVKLYLGWVSDCPSGVQSAGINSAVLNKFDPMPLETVIGLDEQALQNLIDKIKRSAHKGASKKSSTVSSNISSGFKKKTGGDYTLYYDPRLRSLIANLGAQMGIEVSTLVDLVVAIKSESIQRKIMILEDLRK